MKPPEERACLKAQYYKVTMYVEHHERYRLRWTRTPIEKESMLLNTQNVKQIIYHTRRAHERYIRRWMRILLLRRWGVHSTTKASSYTYLKEGQEMVFSSYHLVFFFFALLLEFFIGFGRARRLRFFLFAIWTLTLAIQLAAGGQRADFHYFV